MNKKIYVLMAVLMIPLNAFAAEKKDAGIAKTKFDSSAIWGARRGPNAKAPAVVPEAASPAASAESESINKYYEDRVKDGDFGTASSGSSTTMTAEEPCART